MSYRLQTTLVLILFVSLFLNYLLLKPQEKGDLSELEQEATELYKALSVAQKQRDSLLKIEPLTVEVIKDSIIYLPQYQDMDRDGVITFVRDNFQVIVEDSSVVTLLLEEVYNKLREKDSCCKNSEAFEKEYIFVTGLLADTRKNNQLVTQLKDSLLQNKDEQIEYLSEKDRFKMLAGAGFNYGQQLGFNIKLGCQVKQKHLVFVDLGSIGNSPYIGLNYAITYR